MGLEPLFLAVFGPLHRCLNSHRPLEPSALTRIDPGLLI